MSATGRGGERRPHDFYETPPECTRALLRYAMTDDDCGPVLDPCCGDGAILRVVKECWDAPVYGFDIDPARNGSHVEIRDALSPRGWEHRGTIITNPPYKHALAFVERAIQEVGNHTVAMLLRLPFLASAARYHFHMNHPADVYVLSKRPSFTGDGKTDATEYAWFVWGHGRGGSWFVLRPDLE